MADLFKKYNWSGPRYTSFPAFPHWRDDLGEQEWKEHLLENYRPDQGVSLYIHIPFCEKPCLFCGCNRIITKNHSEQIPYIKSLQREWEHYRETFGPLLIRGLHLGGGSPTFLSPTSLSDLLTGLFDQSIIANTFQGSIELDPRNTSSEHFQVLHSFGFKRASFGIQDFNLQVQQKVGRVQSFELVREKFQGAREWGFDNLNVDLIYGLPFQTRETIKKTMEKILILDPETISYFGYAHTPWKNSHQKALNKFSLPQSHEKRALYEEGRSLLLSAGYKEIGMDHFSKASDPLYRAALKRQLTRSFMGYIIDESPILIGLGASAISYSGESYKQNEKEIHLYQEEISLDKFSLNKGHILSHSDKRIGKAINEILCNRETDLTEALLYIPKDVLNQTRNYLAEFILDEVITIENGILTVTQKGLPFIRNVCMALDFYLLHQGRRFHEINQGQFSKTL